MYKYITFLFFVTYINAATITEYKTINGCYSYKGNSYNALRVFKKDNRYKFLVVNSTTLDTEILDPKELNGIKCKDSRYLNLLNLSSAAPYPLENDGIVSSKDGIVITTDLCPSSKSGFEDRLYISLFKSFKNPAPVTLFITKRWINKHLLEFEKFKNWQKEGKLDITWGNHTAYHHYHPKAPIAHNFVLSAEENLTEDILDNELELLKFNVTPSVFFRFPGLVSDKNSVNIVKNFGLIIVGSNSWLAEGKKVHKNSIILLHGNKNEPRGIDMFLKLLKEGNIEDIKDIKSSL